MKKPVQNDLAKGDYFVFEHAPEELMIHLGDTPNGFGRALRAEDRIEVLTTGESRVLPCQVNRRTGEWRIIRSRKRRSKR